MESLWYLTLLSTTIHLILIVAVFDLYFTSPLVTVYQSHRVAKEPSTNRLVLIVGDGLRADSFEEAIVAGDVPFLLSRRQVGSYGVANTRVPTETRPGHVALIGGFYEDVSAIFRGWKENPVDFDSLFNESTHTWGWGSPDVVPMFAKGGAAARVTAHCYSSEMEDFSSDSRQLDTWVFDEVTAFLKTANSSLRSELERRGTVLFLHLLGIDTAGHASKPHSMEYRRNIAYVDNGVKDIVQKIDDFYNNDMKTTYVFAVDHGMADWGSHGAGHPHETRTPFVVWGAGVAKAGPLDLAQSDFATMMACFAGIPIPVNSLGRPAAELFASKDAAADCALASARQLSEMAAVQHSERQRTSIAFRPYTPSPEILQAEVQSLAAHVDSDHVLERTSELISHLLAAQIYYHTYDNLFLGGVVTATFLLWLLLIFLNVFSATARSSNTPSLVAGILGIAAFVLLLTIHAPVTYYVYLFTPIVLVYFIAQYDMTSALQWDLVSKLLLSFLLLESSIWGYHYRWVLSLNLIALAALGGWSRDWRVFFSLLAPFPFLPVVTGEQSFALVFLAAAIAFAIFTRHIQTFSFGNCSCQRVYTAQLVLFLACCVLKGIAAFGNPPLFVRPLSWLALIVNICLPFTTCSPKSIFHKLVLWDLSHRLTSLSICAFTIHFLLSVSYEPLFFLALLGVLFRWLNSCIAGEHKTPSAEDNISTAFLTVVLINVAFLGPANIASINSFDLVQFFLFVTHFQPFVMVQLGVLKLLCPVTAVAVTFCSVTNLRRLDMPHILLLILLLSDFCGLHFFFLVTNEGSWLEIGISISHYAIHMLLTVALSVMVALAKILLTARIGFADTHTTDQRR